jgi:hypothetical protein
MAFKLLFHADNHVENIESIEYDFEVLICEELDEEVEKSFTVNKDVDRIRINTVMNIMEQLINSFGSNSPIVLSVHNSLYFISSDEFVIRIGFPLFIDIEIVIMDVRRESNV